MTPGFVYLSHGRLVRKAGDEPATTIHSEFAQSIRDRAFELQRRHSWKAQGRGARFMSRAALWGADTADPVQMKINVTGCCRGPEQGDLYYSLQSPEISALLLQKNGGTEQRLLHTSDFRVGHLSFEPETGRLALSILHRGGSTIAVMNGDGGGFTELTQGESVDESPQWCPGAPGRIIFQSAGLAQNEQGAHVGKGPYSIQSLDVESGAMTSLAEDPLYDFLAPQAAPDGSLYFIRRPYSLAEKRSNPLRLVEDILLFPFRLIYAIFQFLNFFTMIYTGKPLSKVGTGVQRYMDEPRMVLWGNLVEARKNFLGAGEGRAGLVPSSWELCRKPANGQMEVLAKGVLSYDLQPDAGIVYSNGAAIYRRTREGQVKKLHSDAMIQQVIALSGRATTAAPSLAASEPVARSEVSKPSFLG